MQPRKQQQRQRWNLATTTTTTAAAAMTLLLLFITNSASTTTTTHAFIINTPLAAAPQTTSSSSSSALAMGLFDGVKEAFGAPASLERSAIDAERETPIDRWMGWSVSSEEQRESRSSAAVPDADFVDAMDEANYIAVELTKPMGIVFEENDADYGGIYIQSLKPDGVAAKNGALQVGDQLVAVNAVKVSGMPFDEALGTIVDATEGDTTKLLLFRGGAKQFYGPTGVGKEWLDEFIAKGGVAATSATAAPAASTEEKKE